MHYPSANDLSTITAIYQVSHNFSSKPLFDANRVHFMFGRQIGCVLGCVLAATIGLKLGRRWTIITGCILVIIGGAVQAAAYNPEMSRLHLIQVFPNMSLIYERLQ